MNGRRPLSAEEALAHSDWVGRLARALTDDASDAEDLAQDAWEASAKAGRPLTGELGAWLTGVLRKLSAMRARSVGRRRRETGLRGDQMAPGADELLERLETQRLLAQLVAALPEPVRLVLFLRFYEGLSSAQIAAQLDVPAGTVRWRLKSGVDALRARLDERFEADRSRWLGLVLPLAPRPELTGSWLPGVLFMKANKLVVALLISLFALLGFWLWPSSEVGSRPSTTKVAQARTDGGGALTTRAQASPSGVLLPAWLGQPGVAPRRVAGRVLLEGAPLAGARVRLEPEPLPAGQRADERVTGEDGTFDFGPRPALMHTVSASAPGRTGDVKDVDLRDPTAHPDSLELRLTGCAARLVGHVLDSARGPIEHAEVRPARGLGVESNGRGEFELCVRPGSSSLHVDAEGYGPLSLKVLVFGRTSRDIVLIPEAVIVGRVVDLETGAPVAGALVIANPGHFTGAEAVRGATVVSGADGRFQLPVAPGDFAVTATLASGSTWPPAMVSTIVGRLSDETVLRMRRQSRLRGTVQSAGKPIAGARVTVFSTSGGGRRPEAWSQEDGRFVIQGAPLGPVMFAASPFAVVTPQRVVLSKSEEEVTLEVKPQGSFHGLVTKGGKPVAGASVKANAGLVSVETSTDAEGRYALEGLTPGRYRLLAHSEVAGGFVDKSGEVLGDREARELNLELSFAASIAGRVVSADGTPVEGAMVLYVHGETGDEGRSVTDADGRFLCQQLTGGGAYQPSVFASATAQTPYAAAVGKPFKNVSLADGSSHAEGVTLSINYERKILRGRVVEASGAPAADVILRAEATQPGQEARFSTWVALPRAVSDAQGVFAFEPLPGGPWTVHARAPDGAEAIVPNLATGGADVLITLRLPAGIEGTLDGYEEPPAAIYARPLPVLDRLVQGHLNGSTFRLVLPAGTYLVSAMNAHEGDVRRVEVKEGETTKVKLQSHGRARLTGSVVDYATGAPVAGLICHVLVASEGTAGITRWDVETAPHTDEKGLFSQDPAPAGPLHVSCVGDWNELSTASALVSVEKGGQVNVPLAVVRKVPSAAAGDLGLAFDDMLASGATAVLPVIRGVRAGSVAARAGLAVDDLLVAMDGRPIAPLDASGVEMLIINHPPGSKLVLSVLRGGQRFDFTMLTERVQR